MTTFKRLNVEWNAEPNVPGPQARIDDGDVVVTFRMNHFLFERFAEDDPGRLRFASRRRFRFGGPDDEGWFRGQCRFKQPAPKRGEFYEVGGDLRLSDCPDNRVVVSEESEATRRFLFHFRDNMFECDATEWSFDVLKAGGTIERIAGSAPER